MMTTGKFSISISAIVSCVLGASTPAWALQRTTAQANRHEPVSYIVEIERENDQDTLASIKAMPGVSLVEHFAPFQSPYFNRLYKVISNPAIPATSLKADISKHAGVVEVSPIFSVNGSGLEIPAGTKALSNDDLTEYQWGYKNQGQISVKDIDDTHSMRAKGLPGVDIQLPDQPELDATLQKDVVVGVLDSGLDLEHEDIQGAIALNEPECVNGKLPPSPKEDKDGNGYVGDCMGWNFVTIKKNEMHRPYDNFGHGTHVAGIIAARTGNKMGIRSITNRIKVLPIMVLDDPQRKEKPDKPTPGSTTQPATTPTGLSDRITLGILYAISRKVDVINMSLGWPISLDTTYLRKAIEEALKRNIVIVAAAGNNSNNSPVFPCAYEGVICVGAVSPEGTISEFSNYGGKVDVGAPGEQILSLLPFKLDPTLFSVQGYEIMTGTSQASPFVAAAAATLKSRFPNITNREVYERLVGASKAIPVADAKKYFQNGMIQLKDALNAAPMVLIRPVFKALKEIAFEQSSLNPPVVEIPLQNFGSLSGTANITVKVTGAGIEAAQISQTITLNSDERKSLSVPFKVTDTSASNKIGIEVTVDSNGTSQSFRDETEIVVSLQNHSNLKRVPVVVQSDRSTEAGGEREGQVFGSLRTVDTKFPGATPEYYLVDRKDKSFKVRIFRMQNGSLVELPKTIDIENSDQFIGVERWDINDDGKPDYFVRTIVKVANVGLTFQFTLRDQNLDPLYGDKSLWLFRPEDAIDNVEDIINFSKASWVPYDIEGIGRVRVPFFLGTGVSPKADLDPDGWAPKDDTSSQRIFYFPPKVTPDGIYVQTRMLDSYSFLKKVEADLKLTWRDGFAVLSMIPQNASRFAQGVGMLVIQAGAGYLKQPYILSIKANGKTDLQPIDSAGLPFDAYEPLNVVDLKNGDFFSSISMQRLYDSVTARWTMLDLDAKRIIPEAGGILKTSNPIDSITSSLTVFSGTDATYAFFLSKDNLLLQKASADGKKELFERPIVRFSFLPGTSFNELFFPVILGQPGKFSPAFYVDATQLNTHHVYLVSTANGLSSPINYNLAVSSQCQALTPSQIDNQFHFTFFCKVADKQFELLYLPMD